MPGHSRHGWVISPGSAALADILANSVAVILILILVTLAYRQEQARSELERNTDITTILARQVATSVVFNDLPSSPPSVLHDYDSCDIPHDCEPMLYPILELHRGFLRIFNTNTRIYRAELLRQENAFDRYLAGLTPEAQEWIRMDIHSISEYYLVLGIMQEHGLRPRHWHYLGEHVPPLANDSLLAERIAGIVGWEDAPPGISNQEGGGIGSGGHGATAAKHRDADILPGLEGAHLGGIGVLEALNYDSLLPPSAEGRAGGSPSGNPFAPQRNRRGGSIFDRPVQPGPLGTAQQAMRLFVPNTAAAPGQGPVLQVSAENYAPLMLSYLFKLLEAAREARAFEPQQQNRWLLSLAQNPQAMAALPHFDLVR